ncbi:protein transport protein sec24-like at4g32640 [Phtheirospermum japonicum]|uniref:Protein transport protein sec24-like at4g32640 n=1 Tax=Phtheirospermum japonicum TaxID=374723 RepID=A0A830BEI8_9LAMI|nr:protein transport protein sec24-like at4g32640 [Phtheirospermum japonicum]
MNESTKDRFHEADAIIEESESLSDIDVIEVDLYLHNEEKKLKKIIWEEMNKEYLEEQAAKEAAALAAKKAYEATFANCSGDVEAAQRLAAAAAEAVAKSKKEKQQKRAADLKNMEPAQTTHEAAKQALDRKRLGSKIRLDALEKLFDESVNLILDFGILEQENPVDTKKSRTEVESDHDDKYPNNSKDDTEASWNKTKLLQQRVQSRDYEGLANYLRRILT